LFKEIRLRITESVSLLQHS